MANTKVLIWLNRGPRGFIHFGIADRLQHLGPYQFYGIVMSKAELEFFQQQKTVPFEKLWYFHDSYTREDVRGDVNHLKAVEEKYRINYWLVAYAERHFYEYRTHFYKFSREEILKILDGATGLFLDIFNRVKPDFVIMQAPGENFGNLLLYKLAEAAKIKTFFTIHTPLFNRILISGSLDRSEIASRFLELKKSGAKAGGETMDEDFIKSHGSTQIVKSVLSAYDFRRKDNLLSMAQRYIANAPKYLDERHELQYKERGRTVWKMLKFKIQSKTELKAREAFINEFSLTALPANEKFVYFPLQTEPEATTLVFAPFYTDQIALVRNIAKSLPVDHVLYVKEHPNQKVKGWRPVSFYRKLLEMPNVRLVHPNVDNYELIKKCGMVITIIGTTGLEALFHRKPALIFGNVFYDCLSMVRKVTDINELPKLVRDGLANFKHDPYELYLLTEAIKQETVEVRLDDMISHAIPIGTKGRRVESSPSMEKVSGFLEAYKDDFGRLAQAFHDKFLAEKKVLAS